MPTEVLALDGMSIKCLASGSNKSAAINSYGELFTWGSSKNQSLMQASGEGHKDNLKLPTVFATEDHLFTKVAVGLEHVAAITQDGRLYTMGTTEHGKLGHLPKAQDEEEAKKEQERYRRAGYKPGGMDRSKPAVGFVEGELTGKRIVSVACGDKHTVCVTEDGEVYSWGFGRSGALGHGNSDDVTLPKRVEGLQNAVRVECGTDYTIVLDSNGKLHSFGNNRYGQLGLNMDSLKESTPKKIFTSAGQGKIIDFSCGDEHSAYIDARGGVHTWGYGIDG